MKNIEFDWKQVKDGSFDNQWKSIIEIIWNSAIPFLCGAFAVLYVNILFIFIWMIVAFLHLEIKRTTQS